jgi:hypothetical protein
VSKDRDQARGRDQLMATSKLDSPVSQTGPSSFCSPRSEATIKDYHTWDSSSTSLVSSMPHTQLEVADPVDEGTEDVGGGGRE